MRFSDSNKDNYNQVKKNISMNNLETIFLNLTSHVQL